ncbi:reverse transcriptase domain-containing protein [Tanacetum coccineum]
MEKLVLALFELEAFDITYRPGTSIRGQILADFIAKRLEEDDSPVEVQVEEAFPYLWTRFTDGSSCLEGSGVGLIFTNSEGVEFTYALRFKFDASNNKAEYEALIAGLRIAEQMGVQNLSAKVDSRLVANQINGSYITKEESMIQYLEKAETIISNFKNFSIEKIPQSENKQADTLSKIASTSFAHLTKQVLVEVLKEKSIEEKEILAVVEEEGYSWMTPLFEYLTDGPLQAEYVIEAKPVATIIGNQVKKFVWDNIVCRLRLPGEIIYDNGKQFRDNPFKDWCEKLNIKQIFASVKHPQTNGQVERANRSLGEGIKASLVEIGMPSLRCTKVNQAKNDKGLLLNLDILEEKKEKAAAREVRSKAKMEKYYNAKVRSTTFRPLNFVHHINEAIHVKESGKLGPKW